MNPDIMTAEGHIDMASSHAPIQFPADITSALNGNNAASGSAATSSSSSASAGPSSSSTSSSSSGAPSATQSQKSGARANVVSGALVGAVVVVVSFLAL